MKTKALAIVLLLAAFTVKSKGQVYSYKLMTENNLCGYTMTGGPILKDNDGKKIGAFFALEYVDKAVILHLTIMGSKNDNIKAIAQKSESQGEIGGILCSSNKDLFGYPDLRNLSKDGIDGVALSFNLLFTMNMKKDNPDMDEEDRQAEAIQLLRSYDIKGIIVGDITITFDNFKTSATIDAMLTDLAKIRTFPGSNTKRNTNGGGSSNTPKKTTTPTSPKTKPTGFNFLREQIKRWQELRNGTLAERSGAGVVIYGSNGYAYTGSTPEALKNKIEEVNKANGKIEDVCVTENGDYCIIFDGNGYTAKGPTNFLNELAGFNRRKEKIRSVAIADGGTWAIVGETNTKCANTTMLQFIINARNKYGTIYSVSLSNMGAIVVCCERGVAWNNYVPNNVIEAIKKANFSVRYVKFSTNGKFIITDGNKTSRYNM